MNPRLADLYQQQGRLLERVATQRQTIAEQCRPIQHAARVADAAQQWLRGMTGYLRGHPLLVVAAVAAVLIVKPRRAWVWSKRGYLIWRRWRGLQRWVSLYRLWL